MGELGLLGMVVPERMGRLVYAITPPTRWPIEEIAAGCASCSTLMSVHNSVGCAPILAFGTEAQKQTLAARSRQRQKDRRFCLTEPQAGSEANNLKTRAVLEDGNGC